MAFLRSLFNGIRMWLASLGACQSANGASQKKSVILFQRLAKSVRIKSI